MDFQGVTQTRRGKDGNCFAACVATFTGIPLDELPTGRIGPETYPAWIAFFGELGIEWRQWVDVDHVGTGVYRVTGVDPADPARLTSHLVGQRQVGSRPAGWWIAGTLEPSGKRHAILMCGNRPGFDAFRWDPAPGRGLKTNGAAIVEAVYELLPPAGAAV